ncbi:MAG: hypothetical protein P4L51_13010 [Puia sp.]|nr:hypothetical protein [Puia sp.]
MQYFYLATSDLITLLYFCEHTDAGFKLSTSVSDARIVEGREKALLEAERLQKESGMKVDIVPV